MRWRVQNILDVLGGKSRDIYSWTVFRMAATNAFYSFCSGLPHSSPKMAS